MYYFIVNTASRTGKAEKIWNEIRQELREKQIEYQAFLTEYKGHARELAEQITSIDDADNKEMLHIVVVGGDGTANEVVNGIQDLKRVIFSYIPTGSGNDLGRGLKISSNHKEALERILSETEYYYMDLGKVSWGRKWQEHSYFNISSGIGLDAEVCRRTNTTGMKQMLNKLHLGNLTYLFQTILAVMTMPMTEAEIQLEDGKKRRIHRLICMAVMNHRCEGGGIPMAPRASDTDSKLSVCIIYGVPRLKAFFLLIMLVLGKHEHFRGIEVHDSSSVKIWLQEPMTGHTDGEDIGDRIRLQYQCLPGKLTILK